MTITLATMTDSAREGAEGFLRQILGDDLTNPDAVARYQACTPVQDLLAAAVILLGEIRKGALAELEASGLDREAIAQAVGGISRQRVGQILGPKAKKEATE